MEELPLPDAAATAAAVDAARRGALSGAAPSTSAPDLAAAATAEATLAVYAVWLRLTAARLLEWNHNYNVKPREVSAAQTRLTAELTRMWLAHPWSRGLVAVALSAVGRGGDGDMGQRIRDEILAIQSKNGAKGGMMEQWHQKLHNNTSPDDVVICAALLAYIDGCVACTAWISRTEGPLGSVRMCAAAWRGKRGRPVAVGASRSASIGRRCTRRASTRRASRHTTAASRTSRSSRRARRRACGRTSQTTWSHSPRFTAAMTCRPRCWASWATRRCAARGVASAAHPAV